MKRLSSAYIRIILLSAIWLSICVLMPEGIIARLDTANLRAYWAALTLFWRGANPYDLRALIEVVSQNMGVIDGRVENIWHLPAIFVFPLGPAVGEYVYFLRIVLAISTLPYLILCVLLLENRLLTPASSGSEACSKLCRLASLAFLVTFVPALHAIRLSPVTNLELFAFVLFLVLVRKSERCDRFIAGMSLALTLIKPPVLYLVYVHLFVEGTARRDFATIAGFLSGLLSLILLPWLVQPEIYHFYSNLMATPPTDWMNPTFGTWLEIFSGAREGWIKFLPPIFTLLTYSILQARRWVRGQPFSDFESIAAISVLTCPYLWGYDFVFLLPLMLITIKTVTVKPSLYHQIILLAALSINIVPLVLPDTAYSHYFIWYPLIAIALSLMVSKFPRERLIPNLHSLV